MILISPQIILTTFRLKTTSSSTIRFTGSRIPEDEVDTILTTDFPILSTPIPLKNLFRRKVGFKMATSRTSSTLLVTSHPKRQNVNDGQICTPAETTHCSRLQPPRIASGAKNGETKGKERRDTEPAQQHRPTTPWWRALLVKGKSNTQHFAHRKVVKLASSLNPNAQHR